MIFKFSFVASAILAVATTAPAQAASDGESASVPVRTSYAAQLGPHARDKYRDIFAAIHAGEWADAAAKLDAMPEGPLHAVARAELYLAKGSPKVSGEALAALAEKAPDLPQAQALERLALSRGVATVTDLPAPQDLRWLGSAPRRGKVAGSAARASAMSARLVPLLKGDRPNEAEAVLVEMTPELDPETLTEWQQRISWSYYLTGDDVAARRLAEELDDALRVLSTFDEGPDLVLYYKQLMVLEGHEEYSWHFNETDRLSASQHDFLTSQWRQFKEWWKNWPGARR